MGISSLLTDPLVFLLWMAAILVALTVHEFSHALAATWLGDPTAQKMGRLSLNPLAHVDWFGLVALVLVGLGWGKPVPFNPYMLRDQKWGPLYIGLAGPLSNLMLLTISGLLLHLTIPALGAENLLVIFLSLCFLINTALMLFNLIPMPPLDGSKILLAILHGSKWQTVRHWIEHYGSWVLMALIFMDMLMGVGPISLLLGWPRHWITQIFGLSNLLGV